MYVEVSWGDGRVERILPPNDSDKPLVVGKGGAVNEVWLHGKDNQVVRIIVRGDECPTMILRQGEPTTAPWRGAIRQAIASRRGELATAAGIPKAADLTDADVAEIFESIVTLIDVVSEKEHDLSAARELHAENLDLLGEASMQLINLRSALDEIMGISEDGCGPCEGAGR